MARPIPEALKPMAPAEQEACAAGLEYDDGPAY